MVVSVDRGTSARRNEAVDRTTDVAASRRRLILDTLGIVASSGGFGLVYGLSARTAGFSIVEAAAMSLLVFAGASQFVRATAHDVDAGS
jgi:predicted branched-subunit amino acid permease